MQDIYDAIYLVAMDPTTQNNIITLYTDQDPNSDAFAVQFYTALLGVCYDHPELWWIYPWNGAYNVAAFIGQPANGHNVVYLQMDKPYENFETDVKAFNAAVDEFLKDIDTSKSDAEIALQVHDKLINLAIYDNEVLDKNLNDFAHTAFGPLVANSRGMEHNCVCDGYSLAYEYLVGQLGIPATVVTGMAGDAGADGQAKEGAGNNDVVLRCVLTEVFQRSQCFWNLSDFINKDQRVLRINRLSGQDFQIPNDLFHAKAVRTDTGDPFILVTIEDETLLIFCGAKLRDQIGLADLPGALDHQGLPVGAVFPL